MEENMKVKCRRCNNEFSYSEQDIHSEYIEDGITRKTDSFVICSDNDCRAMVFINKINENENNRF